MQSLRTTSGSTPTGTTRTKLSGLRSRGWWWRSWAAAAAHSLGTPLSTIKIITQELSKQLKGQKDVIQDIELLSSQVKRCDEILKKLSLNPNEEDDFIDEDQSLRDYLKEIILGI